MFASTLFTPIAHDRRVTDAKSLADTTGRSCTIGQCNDLPATFRFVSPPAIYQSLTNSNSAVDQFPGSIHTSVCWSSSSFAVRLQISPEAQSRHDRGHFQAVPEQASTDNSFRVSNYVVYYHIDDGQWRTVGQRHCSKKNRCALSRRGVGNRAPPARHGQL